MSITTTFLASDGSGESIVIERNRLWENVKIYYDGKLIKTCKYASETREGVQFSVEGLGTVTLKVHSVSLKPKLLVNDIEYFHKNGSPQKGKLLLPVIVFGFLSLMNVIFFALALQSYLELHNWPFAIFALSISIFYMVGYIVTTVLLSLRYYFFYFVGTGMFIISSLYVLLILCLNEIDYFFLTLFIVRIIVLTLLLAYLKRALLLFKNRNGNLNEHQILDDTI